MVIKTRKEVVLASHSIGKNFHKKKKKRRECFEEFTIITYLLIEVSSIFIIHKNS